MKVKVQNMISANGYPVPNQFIIYSTEQNPNGDDIAVTTFQSYNTIIAQKRFGKVLLDKNSWCCSVTTGGYRNQFLNEKKAETQKKIDSGEYILTGLN